MNPKQRNGSSSSRSLSERTNPDLREASRNETNHGMGTESRLALVACVMMLFALSRDTRALAGPPLPPAMAYVANSDDDSVSVISLEPLEVTTTIAVGAAPTYVVSSKDGKKVYVVNSGDGTLSLIDTAEELVIKTIPVGPDPARPALSRDGRWLYVPLSGTPSGVCVIDTTDDTVLTTFPTPPTPSSIAAHPVREEIWIGFNRAGVGVEVRSTVDFAVLATRSSVRRLSEGGFAFSSDGSEVLATESCGNCGRWHEYSGNPVAGTIAPIREDIFYDNTGSATGLALNPTTEVWYMAKWGQNGRPYIKEFGGGNRTLILTDGRPDELTVSHAGDRLYVVVHGVGRNFVSVFDTASLSPIGFVDVGANPQGIALVTRNSDPAEPDPAPNIAPTIVSAADATIDCAPASGTYVNVHAAVSDPDSDQLLNITVAEGTSVLATTTVRSPASNVAVTFPHLKLTPGLHHMTLTVTDGTANASCTSSVLIRGDTTGPTFLRMPENVSAFSESSDGAIVNYPNATASDHCSIPKIAYSQASGTKFPVGTTTVTCTAIDGSGNTAKQTFRVTVSPRYVDLRPAWEGRLRGYVAEGAPASLSGGWKRYELPILILQLDRRTGFVKFHVVVKYKRRFLWDVRHKHTDFYGEVRPASASVSQVKQSGDALNDHHPDPIGNAITVREMCKLSIAFFFARNATQLVQ